MWYCVSSSSLLWKNNWLNATTLIVFLWNLTPLVNSKCNLIEWLVHSIKRLHDIWLYSDIWHFRVFVPDVSSWNNIWYYSLRPQSFYGNTIFFQMMLFAHFDTDRVLTLCPKPLHIYFSSLKYKHLTNLKYMHKNFVFPTLPT